MRRIAVIIHGERGVGKTKTVKQIKAIQFDPKEWFANDHQYLFIESRMIARARINEVKHTSYVEYCEQNIQAEFNDILKHMSFVFDEDFYITNHKMFAPKHKFVRRNLNGVVETVDIVTANADVTPDVIPDTTTADVADVAEATAAADKPLASSDRIFVIDGCLYPWFGFIDWLMQKNLIYYDDYVYLQQLIDVYITRIMYSMTDVHHVYLQGIPFEYDTLGQICYGLYQVLLDEGWLDNDTYPLRTSKGKCTYLELLGKFNCDSHTFMKDANLKHIQQISKGALIMIETEKKEENEVAVEIAAIIKTLIKM